VRVRAVTSAAGTGPWRKRTFRRWLRTHSPEQGLKIFWGYAMRGQKLDFNSFSLTLPDGWIEMKDEDLENLITFINPANDCGAFQISGASHSGGLEPNVTIEDLESLLSEFLESHEASNPFDWTRTAGPVSLVGASFEQSGNLLRVWYLSNGRDVLFATYVCETELSDIETKDRESILRSITFRIGDSP
jgi:hypothetical protein